MSQERPSRNDIRHRGLLSLCTEIDISLEVLINRYVGKHFSNSSIEKKSLIENVLNDTLTEEQLNFIIERCSLSYHRDRRGALDYGRDLIIGWLAEDAVFTKLAKLDFEIQFNGNDQNREFLNIERIGTEADYLLNLNGKMFVIELVMSWETYWKRTNQLDLRDSKFSQLSNKSENCLLIGIEPMSQMFFIVQMKVVEKYFKWRQNPAWGNKGVYTLAEINKIIRPISMFNKDFLVSFLH